MQTPHLSNGKTREIAQKESVRALSAGRGLLCFILGLLGALPLIVLTPPFRVPDEFQHFLRAYQLSELQLTASMYEGEARTLLPASQEAKLMLPSSLAELAESFLGTRKVFIERDPTVQPLQGTFSALDRPLDPGRRELLSLLTIAKAPLSYLPQASAIAVGRWLGAGPLLLLYLGRLANALVAVATIAWAVRLMPTGREMTMLFGLLPMTIYLYASVSADATVIATAFLFTAVALSAQFRGHWTRSEVALAITSGLVFCTQRPNYAPLLLIGLPTVLIRERARDNFLVQVGIVATVVGAAVGWMYFTRPMWSELEGVSVGGQLNFIAADPLRFMRMLLTDAFRSRFYYDSAVGVLGWMTIYLPRLGYVLPLCGFVLATLATPRNEPKLPAPNVAWNILLLAGTGVLTMTAGYLLWNPVGSPTIVIMQGRYLLPPLALVAATWCSVVKVPVSRWLSRACLQLLVAVIVAEYIVTYSTIVAAYHLF
jgi:hypothetical protein